MFESLHISLIRSTGLSSFIGTQTPLAFSIESIRIGTSSERDAYKPTESPGFIPLCDNMLAIEDVNMSMALYV